MLGQLKQETRALSQKTRALPQKTRALPQKTRALPWSECSHPFRVKTHSPRPSLKGWQRLAQGIPLGSGHLAPGSGPLRTHHALPQTQAQAVSATTARSTRSKIHSVHSRWTRCSRTAASVPTPAWTIAGSKWSRALLRQAAWAAMPATVCGLLGAIPHCQNADRRNNPQIKSYRPDVRRHPAVRFCSVV